MRPDVAGLMLQTVEGLLAQRALVGAGEVLAGLVLGLLGVLEERGHEADSSRRHGSVGGGLLRVGGRGVLGGRRL